MITLLYEKLDLFLGRFNSVLEGKLFAILDETATFYRYGTMKHLSKQKMAIEAIICMTWITIQLEGQDFNSVPEYVRKEYTSREDYFCELFDIIKNDKDTVNLFVDFLMSIYISEYRPSIFNSSTKDHHEK